MSIAGSRSRHHQLPGLPQVQPQGALQPPVLVRLQQPAVAALGDEQLDLLGRVDVAVARGGAHGRSSRMPLPFSHVMKDGRSTATAPSGGRIERRLRRVLQRQRLRDQLAKNLQTVSTSRTTAAAVDCAATCGRPPSAANMASARRRTPPARTRRGRG